MRPNLGDIYCQALIEVYKERIHGLPDLVCYWFEKARTALFQSKIQRVGLLATQAIRGGTNRQILDSITRVGNIFWGWSDREWILDGAKVHVSMIGFDDGQEKTIILDDCPVNSINSDLTSVVDLSKSVILKENLGISFQGVILRGAFNITKVQAEMMIAQENNPNSRPNTDVIRPRMTGKDVVSHSSNEYVIDFGVNTSLNRASEYLLPIEYLRKNVFPFRQKAKQEAAKEK